MSSVFRQRTVKAKINDSSNRGRGLLDGGKDLTVSRDREPATDRRRC